MINVEIDRRVATLTLDDPKRRNALSVELCGELVAVLAELEAGGDIGALVVTGEGPAFCAGADLTQLGSSREQGLRSIYEGFLAVARSPIPSVAAVNGAAVGAGMNLALACDVRVAGRSARFDTRFLDLGIHPGGGHTWMLRNIVGPQTAMAMLVFGERLDGAAALRAGLVLDCVEDGDLLERARSLAAHAAQAPTELTRRVTASVRRMGAVDGHGEAMELELVDQLWSMDQPEFAERLAALQARISRSS